MTAQNYRGGMLISTLEQSESFQAEIAPIGGPDTRLSFVLRDEPISADAVSLFFGSTADDEMLLMYQGVHYRVDVPNRRLYWLGAAPFPLTSTSVIGVVYYGTGKYL